MAVAELASRMPRCDLPVLTQEMRVRQRGARPFLVLFVYVAVLCFVALMGLNDAIAQSGMIGIPLQTTAIDRLAVYGRMLYGWLSLAQLLMIILIVPAYGAGAVTTEREKGTFESLAITLLSSSSIITQKMAAAVSQALMLMICSAPVLGVAFMLGGVAPFEVLVVYLLLAMTAVMLGAMAVLCSCWFSSTRAAVLAAYTGALSFVVGVPMLGRWLPAMATRGIAGSMDYYFPLTVVLMVLFAGAVLALIGYGLIKLLVKWSEDLAEGSRFPWALSAFSIICLFLALVVSPVYFVVALAPWLILPLMTESVRERWRIRAFRITVFGAVYALVLLAISNGALSDRHIDWLYTSEGTFVPLLVNPLYALSAFAGTVHGTLDAMMGTSISAGAFSLYHGHWVVSGYRYYGDAALVAVVATLAFAVGASYLCRQLSVGKLEAMRRV